MAKRPDPEITETQIEELRRRKVENSGGFLKYLDIVEVFGPGFPISLVLARKLLPPDLHMELLQCVANQELFFDRIEDLLADFLDAVVASLPKPPPKDSGIVSSGGSEKLLNAIKQAQAARVPKVERVKE